MPPRISQEEYRALAEFRYRIRMFLNMSDSAAREAGIEPQHYLAMLAIRGLPPNLEPTVGVLAERLQLKHHSMVEMLDRMTAHGWVRRVTGTDDRRQVMIVLTPRGSHALDGLARTRLAELRSSGPGLIAALDAVIRAT